MTLSKAVSPTIGISNIDNLAGVKLLITGGLGYVGGRITRHFMEHCPDVRLRLTTRRDPEQAPEWAQRLDVVQADVLGTDSLRRAVEGVDAIIHLAAVNEAVSARDPLLALDVNTAGTYRLLEAAQEQGVSRFIYFSTFHVYGPWARGLITEETPTRPAHPYASTHRAAEDMVNWFRQAFGFQTLILRVSNGFGYAADSLVDSWTLAFNDLCRQAVETGRITLRSGGRQQRDFIALTDVARAVEHFLRLERQRWGDGLFNLGSGSRLSILQVADTVAAAYHRRYGRDLSITAGSDPEGTVHEPLEYDARRLRETGFVLTHPVEEEVQGTLALCETLRQGKASGV